MCDIIIKAIYVVGGSMKKKDLFVMFGIVIAAVIIYFISQAVVSNNDNSREMGTVYYRDQIVLSFDVHKDHVYEIDGDYGTLYLEVEDGQWHMTEDTECPNHLCVKQGWAKSGDIIPITCLPNNVFVEAPGIDNE